jgi:hypothetical protein
VQPLWQLLLPLLLLLAATAVAPATHPTPQQDLGIQDIQKTSISLSAVLVRRVESMLHQ